MQRQSASALVIRFAKLSSPDKRERICLTLAALEGTLPEGDVQQQGRFTDPKTYEAVYSWPSQAIYVLQGLQTAVRRLRFRAAVALGAHWSDVIHLEGVKVTPHALSVAKALAERLQSKDHVWTAFQGYAAWDQVATAAFSVTCNVRNERSLWQREAEEAYRINDSSTAIATRLNVSLPTVRGRLSRGHIRQVDYLDDVLARQLDAVASQQSV